MADREGVGNAVSGSVTGALVQAGTIQRVVLSPQDSSDAFPVPRQLPPSIRDFTGRGEQLAVLDDLLGAESDSSGAVVVAVVDGAGGAGKTTLVVQWAHRVQHRFPDGTLFVNLRGFGPSAPLDPAVVLVSFLHALGVPEGRIPAESEALVGLYRSVLADRRVLIVLDNAAEAEQVRLLLPGAPGCVVLVTSRIALTELVVAEAARRASVVLFSAEESHELLRAILGRTRVDAESAGVADLVRVCSGLPLAVRVAATRVAARPGLTVADVVAEIIEDQGRGREDMFGGDVNGAVRAVLDWSYARLSAEQAKVFRRLGLHPGLEFGVLPATAFAGMDAVTVYRCLEVLAEFHLVEPTARHRYRMHERLYAYAAHRVELDESVEERDLALARGLAWYARTADKADQLVFPGISRLNLDLGAGSTEPDLVDRLQALEWLMIEQPTLLAALRSAVQYGLYKLAVVLSATARFLILGPRPLLTTELEAVNLGVSAAQAGGIEMAEAFLRVSRGETLCALGRWGEAEADFEHAVAKGNDQPWAGRFGLGSIHLQHSRYPEAREQYLLARAAARRAGNARAEAVAECNLATIAVQLGDYEQALYHAERELPLRQQAGDTVGAAYALYDAARAWQGLEQYATAISLLDQALGFYQGLAGTEKYAARALEVMATCAERIGDVPRAVASLKEAASILVSLEDPAAETVRQRWQELAGRRAEGDG